MELNDLAQRNKIATLKIWSLIRNNKLRSKANKRGVHINPLEWGEWAEKNHATLERWRLEHEDFQSKIRLSASYYPTNG